MENSPRGTSSKDFGLNLNHSEQPSKMSMIAMATPTIHAPFRREYWDEARAAPEFAHSRPRPEADRVALPSIRQVIPNFPELQLRIAPQTQDVSTRTPVSSTSPTSQHQGVMTPDYVHSPSSNKRRRLSIDEDNEERTSRVPRLYNSPPRTADRQTSHTLSPDYAPRTMQEQWGSALRTSPRTPQGGLPAMRSPATIEPVERPDTRPILPSFPPPASMERGPAPPMPRMPGHSNDDYHHEAPRPLYMHAADARFDPAGSFRQPPPYGYSYHHPSRIQSLSMGAIHPLDRPPFSAVGYGPHYGEYMRFGDMAMNAGADNKQRKRRGNLPKETTDKLRAWFHSHLHHPYPTEDEKQELMRQTGLQMNQISNWFINARRRQLPQMITNAQTEQNISSKVVPLTERGDYEDAKNRHSPTTSDGGDSTFDDDLRRPQHIQRAGSY